MAVKRLLGALCEESQSLGVEVDLLEAEQAPHGLMSALVALRGDGAEILAKDWEGSIRWICPSPLRPGWRRKNWFVGVSYIAPPPPAQAFRESDLRFEAYRASGPGGQHVNKTNSAVRVTHLPTGLTATAQEERSQHRNKALATARLAAILATRDREAETKVRLNRWSRHNVLIRGDERRTYEGLSFRRVLSTGSSSKRKPDR